MPDCDNILDCCSTSMPLTYDSSDGVVAVPPPIAPEPPPDTPTGEYCNTEQSYTADCPEGYTGASQTVTIAAGEYCAATQGEADNLALAAAIEQAMAALDCTYECAAETDLVLDEVIDYTTVCSVNPGTFHFTGSNTVRADDIFDLSAEFPFETNWDGNCPLGWFSRPRRAHTAGSFTIGPYAQDMVIFAATAIFVDDVLTIGGTDVVTVGGSVCNNTILYNLTAGATATVQCYERGGAWCFAVGYLGVAPAACVEAEETGCSSPTGWCELGTEYDIENIVPVMTSNTTPSGVASGTSYPVGGEPWRAFDGNSADGFTGNYVNPSTPFVLGYQFTTLVEVAQYHLVLELASPADVMVILAGSEDGVTWKDLDTQYNAGGANIDSTYTLTYPATHKYWRVSISDAGDPDLAPAIASVYIPTLELLDADQKCCPEQTSLALNKTITYDTICEETIGPFTFVSTYTVRALDVFDLGALYPYTAMWDGICPLASSGGGGRDYRPHPSGTLTIGPYSVDTIVFTATNVYVGGALQVGGVNQIIAHDPGVKNKVLYNLPAGLTVNVEVFEIYGAHCFACGYIGVAEADCMVAFEISDDPPPAGW